MERIAGEAVASVLTANEAVPTVSYLYSEHYKRWIDCSLAAVALLLCLPLLVVTALLVVSTSRGPALFVQERVGRYGRKFKIFKFRTMTERGGGSCRTEDSDPRITAFGRFLRNTKIDELPQIINILNGDMSIIGPRPLSAAETEEIVEKTGIPADSPGFLHMVRPGLIGLEQINRSVKLSFAERFAYNHQYELGLNAGLDLYIFLVAFFQCRFVCGLAIVSAVTEAMAVSFVQ
ncbi:MAG: sugar transferase [Candidatus Obscuribacterales bacterium]|nr:sugar transferase [Candidatus Obscuribacterales bacterium]